MIQYRVQGDPPPPPPEPPPPPPPEQDAERDPGWKEGEGHEEKENA